MTTLGIILIVLGAVLVVALLAFVVCCVIEARRQEQQRTQMRTETMLAELELQRLTRAAVNRMYDEARRVQMGAEPWREP